MSKDQKSRTRLRSLVTITVAAAAVAALAAAPVAVAAPASAVGVVARAAEPVAGEYIVVLRGGTARADIDAHTVAGRYGGTVLDTWTAALNGFSVRLDAASAARLAADPRVVSVRENGIVRVATDQLNPPWGLDRIDQRYLPLNATYSYDTTASTVHAYILDTGIRTTHNEFGGRASVGYDAIGDGRNGQDCNGHGTHVAGTVGGSTYGVAKAVQLVAVRVLNCSGSGTWAQVISGVNWVTTHAVKPAVVNMSLGGFGDATADQAIRNSIASGVTYAIAAGNANNDACYYSPARVTEAITVGALSSYDYRAWFSNYGTCLDLFAPGMAVASAWNTTDTATNTISGTSMASPHVAGAAALYLAANPSAAPASVRNALVAAATTGVVTDPGTGSPNLVLYSGSAPQPMPPPPPPAPAEPAPAITYLSCEAAGGQFSCWAEWTGGTPPLTPRWSPAQYGTCTLNRFFTVYLTVIDAIGRTATASSRFYCWGYE